MTKNNVRLTEGKLREIVQEAVQEALKEGFLSDVGNSIKNGIKTAADRFDDFTRGYDVKEGIPQSIEDLFEGDGWRVIRVFAKGGGTVYAVKRMSGSFGVFDGQEVEDMVDELNIYLDGNGTAQHLGQHPKYKYIELFKIIM
jgi:hypothetical protein